MSERLRPDESREGLRALGGLLLGAGALMLFSRKQQSWGDFPLFLVYAVPAALLYGGALNTIRDTGGVRTWQAVWSVFGLIFVPLALFRFIDLVGGDSSASLNLFWVFGVTAALAFYAGLEAGIRYHLLLGSGALVISGLALLNKIFGFGDDLGLFRGLLGLSSIGLLLIGINIWRSDPANGLRKFSEVFTAAGIAAVLACALSATSALGFLGQTLPLFALPSFKATLFWDVLLLLISLGLIIGGSRIGVRGPVYVGAIGLFLFVTIAGADLDSSLESRDATKLFGWPLLLLALGAGAIALSLSRNFSLGDRPGAFVRSLSGPNPERERRGEPDRPRR